MHRTELAEIPPATIEPRGHSRTVVADGVYCIELSIVNVYTIGRIGARDREWVLVDAGLHLSAPKIIESAARIYGAESRPSAIVLTHAHFDHVGALKQLAAHWECAVYAHPLEMPYLTGRSSYPPPDPMVGGGAMAWLSMMYPKHPIDISEYVLTLPADGSVPGVQGWRWIHTPGHTPGHVALFRDSDRTLIAGDAFVTTRQESMICALTKPPVLNGPPAYFTPDWRKAELSVQILADLEPDVAATGHGHPMRGERLREELHMLADNFREIAVPRRGRYVNQPATADEDGVQYVPPPLAEAKWVAVGAFVAIAGLTLLATRSTSRRRHQPRHIVMHGRM